jgi:hypothetical protein
MSVVLVTVRGMVIDCDTCTMRDVACTDCVVSFLTICVRSGDRVRPAGPGTPDLSEAESRAIAVLARSGLVPPLRLHSASARTG